MKFKVKANPANNVSKSLRITLPVKIAEILEVKEGDTVEYIVNADNNELSVFVQKEKK